ncbi:hypothetical protein CPLU01_02966 [Colletotrichum plurivorum]|uniref:Uncharacterized protein n=1 Tax=Colletotrichum plurivorum TaxID=2175906 RepID=A0A8H6KUM3_9PEZI|nr:hypothetical protein CPLU01_02966 [Colletotrichum plurivorum]
MLGESGFNFDEPPFAALAQALAVRAVVTATFLVSSPHWRPNEGFRPEGLVLGRQEQAKQLKFRMGNRARGGKRRGSKAGRGGGGGGTLQMHTHTQTRRRSSSIRSKSRSRRATRSSKDEEAPAGLGLLTASRSGCRPGSSWESTLPTEDFPEAVDGSLMP